MRHQRNFVNLVKLVIGFIVSGMVVEAQALPCGGATPCGGVMFTPVSRMSVPCGWYLEANGGYANLWGANLPGKVNSNGPGGNVNLGYKFMPYVGLEIGYSLYAGSSINVPSTGGQAGKARHYSFDIAGRGILPISDSGFEAFAKLGAQRLVTKIHVHDPSDAVLIGLTPSTRRATGLYVGLGGQYYFMPEMAVVVQWQRAKGNNGTGTEDLYSVGVSFIFD